MATQGTAYKFPDEADDDDVGTMTELADPDAGAVEVELEVVDDTPEDDRNREPMKEAPKEFGDDELQKYDESVRTRIKKFTKGYHDERRAREAAIREKEEAIRAAQVLAEENKKLQGSLAKGQEALLVQAKRVVDQELEEARKKFREAHDSGDADAVLKAQEALGTAQERAKKVHNYKLPVAQTTASGVQPDPQGTSNAPAPDERALAWQRKNQWFGKDEEMTGFALALHSKLVKEGLDPKSDEYYRRVNTRMRTVFPDAFGGNGSRDTDATSPARRTVVASATRSTAPRKIVLTKSQVEIARRLGVTPQQYALSLVELQRKQ